MPSSGKFKWQYLQNLRSTIKEYEGTLAQRKILQKAAIDRIKPFNKTKNEIKKERILEKEEDKDERGPGKEAWTRSRLLGGSSFGLFSVESACQA